MDRGVAETHPGTCPVKKEPLDILPNESTFGAPLCAEGEGNHQHSENSESQQENPEGKSRETPLAIPFQCQDCGRRFKKDFLFKSHRCARTIEKPYPCPDCEKSFSLRAYLIVHQRIHCVKSPYPKLESGKSFSSCVDLLGAQKRTLSGEHFYSSPKGGKSFIKEPHLKLHLVGHTKEKQFLCLLCEKTFARRSSLNLHHRVHSGERPYSCVECGKSFSWLSSLGVHRKAHSGRRAFSCSECGKSFHQESHFKQHMITHTNEKPFTCQECGKSFSRRWSLAVHETVHSGERHFPCLECGRKFRQNSHLKRHTGRIHSEEVASPDTRYWKICDGILAFHKQKKKRSEMKPLMSTQSNPSVTQCSDLKNEPNIARRQQLLPDIKCENGFNALSSAAHHLTERTLAGQTVPCSKDKLIVRLKSKMMNYQKIKTEGKLCCAEQQGGGKVLHMHQVQTDNPTAQVSQVTPKCLDREGASPANVIQEKLKILHCVPYQPANKTVVIQECGVVEKSLARDLISSSRRRSLHNNSSPPGITSKVPESATDQSSDAKRHGNTFCSLALCSQTSATAIAANQT